MRFLDTVFGDLSDGQPHGYRAGFLPAIAPSLLAYGAVALGAPLGAGAVIVACGAAAIGPAIAGSPSGIGAAFGGGLAAYAVTGGDAAATAVLAVGAATLGALAIRDIAGDAKFAKVKGYNPKSYLAGKGAGCLFSAVLAFNVVSAPLPPEQPKAPVAEPTPSTLEIKPVGGRLCEGFKIANSETTDEQGRKVYILAVPQDCSLAPNP